MKPASILTVGILLLGGGMLNFAIAADPMVGEVLFKAQKCNMCHKIQKPDPTVEVVEGGPPNLWNVGNHRTAEWIIPFIKKEIDLEGRKHKVIWKGKPEDLIVVANWLTTLRDPAKAAIDSAKSATEPIPENNPSQSGE